MHQAFLLVLAGTCVAGASSGAWGQSVQLGNRSPHPAELIIAVHFSQTHASAPPGISVELTNEAGDASIAHAQTDFSGRVEFHTSTGNHRVRIYGSDVEEFNGTIVIEEAESRHTENIEVRLAPQGAFSTAPANPGMISATRVKVPAKAEAEFHKGSKALEKKDYAEAIKRFRAAIAIYPHYDLAYNGLGVASIETHDAPGAEEAFQKAISLNDHFAEAYRNLARLSLAEHNYEETDDLLMKSLQDDPLNAWALIYAAYAELQIKKFDLAIAHARVADGIPHKGLASVHIVAALALEATGQLTEAAEQYRVYLKEDSTGRDAARAKEALKRLGPPASK
jgi:tetratricopeptide (TPR) repeat protein